MYLFIYFYLFYLFIYINFQESLSFKWDTGKGATLKLLSPAFSPPSLSSNPSIALSFFQNLVIVGNCFFWLLLLWKRLFWFLCHHEFFTCTPLYVQSPLPCTAQGRAHLAWAPRHAENHPIRFASALSGHWDTLPLLFKISLSKFSSGGGGSFGIIVPWGC